VAGRLRDENRFVVPLPTPPGAFPDLRGVVSARRTSLTPSGPESSVDHRNPPLRYRIDVLPRLVAPLAAPGSRLAAWPAPASARPLEGENGVSD